MADENRLARVQNALEIIAALRNFRLTPPVCAFYLQKLGDIDEARLIPALERIAQGKGSWPSVDEIRVAAGETSGDPDGLARQAADRIVEGIRRFGALGGPSRLPALKEFLGELCWELVQKLGGWNLLCETTEDDALPTLKAQWRESGKALIAARARGENTALPPSDGIVRPQLTTDGAILRLASVEH